MTKKVRVEDADTSGYKLVVQTFDKRHDGGPDVLVSEVPLNGPCDLRDFYVHSSRYLVIKEV